MSKFRRIAAGAAVALCAAGVLIWLIAGPWIERYREKNGLSEKATGMTVTFLDVGEGDCIIVTADGETMMVDGGSPEYSDTVYSFLKKYSLDRLRYVFCTHPHSDHVGGLSGALNYAAADEAFCCVREYDSRSFEAFERYAGEQGLEITVPECGTQLRLGEAVITVISPSREYEDLNDCSLVLRIDYGSVRVLLTGDAGYDAENDMMKSDYSLRADLLKVGHHGSGSSSYYYFLKEVSPSYAVISVG
ncbi:MAG: MBL fold metallo-hydrolase, partial [Oscillospiraceae bacterium]|nr:MBL fold metallo-hydrolase [Oscillospiraceae bacterium]